MSTCHYCGSPAGNDWAGRCRTCGGARAAGQIPGREPSAREAGNKPAPRWATAGIFVSGVMFWSPFMFLILALFVSALAKPWGIDVSGLWALIDWNTGLVGHVLMTALVLSVPLGLICAAFGGLRDDTKTRTGKEYGDEEAHL